MTNIYGPIASRAPGRPIVDPMTEGSLEEG